MKHHGYICLSVLGLVTACGVVNTVPLDDAYIWPDDERAAVVAADTVETKPAVVNAPTFEYLHVQDTTITVKIKR